MSDTFKLTFLDPCIDTEFVQLTATVQSNVFTDSYTSTDIVFTHNPFTVSPDFCQITVKCKEVTGPSSVLACQDLTDGNLTQNFTPDNYNNDNLTPGTYVFTFNVFTGPEPA